MGGMPHFGLLGPRKNTILTFFLKLECGEKNLLASCHLALHALGLALYQGSSLDTEFAITWPSIQKCSFTADMTAKDREESALLDLLTD